MISNETRLFGLIGYPLGHSFSAQYFNEKFCREGIPAHYELYPMPNLNAFPALCRAHDLSGLNVTYPHKQAILPYLDGLDAGAAAIGAVNVIRFNNGQRIGYNTDTIGFRTSITPLLQPQHTAALILGTGGAAKAVSYALQQLGIAVTFVSRQPDQAAIGHACIAYNEITKETIQHNKLIINCTPLGMAPLQDKYPPIPYNQLTDKHLLYDVIYNPHETLFLQQGRDRGCLTANGLQMLHGQAAAAWEIWNKE